MMTIKEFALLCKCGTQTLRYYDRIDLLKPVKVDPWSGYRYYAQSQAIDFVKIKNLQAADFSIGEIKTLLTQSDQQVYEAFDRKIAEQAQKLERIKEIQQSYLAEKNNMEKVIQEFCGFLLDMMKEPECLTEFGLDPAEAPAITEEINAYMTQRLRVSLPETTELIVTIGDDVYKGDDAITRVRFELDTENPPERIFVGTEEELKEPDFDPNTHEQVWECGGWEHVYEFLDQIPHLESGREYCFWLHTTREASISFAMFMIGAMLRRGYGTDVTMGCSMEVSADGKNHFALMRKK